MNNKLKAVSLLTMPCLLLTVVSRSQENLPRLEIGAGLSSFIYQGDLAPGDLGSFKTARFGVNLFANRILSPSFSLRTNLAIGGLRGDDSKYDEPDYRQQRNFRFRTRIVEISQLVVWNPLNKNYSDKGFYPYLFGGGGLSFVKIRRDWSNLSPEYSGDTDFMARLAQDSAHSLPQLLPFVSLGGGLRFNISPRWAANLESTYRVLFSDYLDGFSIAANPERKDKYHSVSLGVIYRIGKRNTLDCPVVRY